MTDVSGIRRDAVNRDAIALPSHVAGSGNFDRLVDTARDYASAEMTRRYQRRRDRFRVNLTMAAGL